MSANKFRVITLFFSLSLHSCNSPHSTNSIHIRKSQPHNNSKYHTFCYCDDGLIFSTCKITIMRVTDGDGHYCRVQIIPFMLLQPVHCVRLSHPLETTYCTSTVLLETISSYHLSHTQQEWKREGEQENY